MLYHPSAQLQSKSSFYIDVHDVAHQIEQLLATVLRGYEPGVWLPDQVEPVMRAGQQYWFEKAVQLEGVSFLEGAATSRINMSLQTDNRGFLYGGDPILPRPQTPWSYWSHQYIPVNRFEEVMVTPYDVVDVNPNLSSAIKRVVLPHHLSHQATFKPQVPAQGIRIVEAIINTEIEATRAWTSVRPMILEEVLLPFVHSRFADVEHMCRDVWFSNTLAILFDNLRPIIAPLQAQLRAQPFEMYRVNYFDNYQIVLERLGDYRIFEWERIISDPAYQQWSTARSTGQWEQFVSLHDDRTNNPYN